MESRKIIEANVIFSFYKDTDLFKDYVDKIDSFKFFELEESQFYYNMGANLVKQGYKVIDPVSIEAWLSDKPSSKDLFEEYGGYNTIKEIKDLVVIDNFEKYYDDLLKYNILKQLKDKGFNVGNVKIEDMTSNDLYEYFDYQLNDLFIEGITDVRIQDFDISQDYLEERNKGTGLGASIGLKCPRMNFAMGGLRTKNVIIVGAKSGIGKSSFLVDCVVNPLINQNIKTAILSNEQGINEFRDMLISNVLFTEFKYYKITRKKMQSGNFSKEDWKYLKKAQEFINKNYTPYLRFIKMFNYNIDDTKKVIKKLAREGVSHIVYDTFKAENSNNATAHGEMVETSKEIFNIADKLDLCVVWSQQQSIHSGGKRYLDMSCLAGSRQVSEVASQVIMIRTIWDDEFTDEKYDIKPYNLKKDSEGNYVKEGKHAVKEFLELDLDNPRYMLIFLSKNRYGSSDEVYLFHQIANYNFWKELGYAEVSHVDR